MISPLHLRQNPTVVKEGGQAPLRSQLPLSSHLLLLQPPPPLSLSRTRMSDAPNTLPPWILKGQLWTFPITRPLFGKGKLDLPAGTYPEGDELHVSDKEKFAGGLGMLMLVRYRETPVGEFEMWRGGLMKQGRSRKLSSFLFACSSLFEGPYDELVYIPGDFTSLSFPSSSKSVRSLRITGIYVSTQASVDAVRLPVPLSLFLSPDSLGLLSRVHSISTGSFQLEHPQTSRPLLLLLSVGSTTASSSPTLVSISHSPSSSSQPFFQALLTPSTYLTPFNIPIRTVFARGTSLNGYSPLNDFVQPPLVPAPPGRKEGEWMRFKGKIVGGVKGCWIEGRMPGKEGEEGKGERDLGDGKATTRGSEVWKFGAYCEEVTLVFGESETLMLD